MSILVLAIGKKHDSWIVDGLAMYEKRLRKPFDLSWQLIPHQPSKERAVTDESARLISFCQPDDYVILLDERGKQFSSEELSQKLVAQFNWSQRVVFIIGGAYGVNQQVRDRADLIWALSSLVFPHQLARLLLVEQVYRAQSIANNEPYHHN